MKDAVKEYYGKVLQSSDDLKTDACCTDTQIPNYLKKALSQVQDEVMSRYYGCGLVAPQKLEGMRILDLGSGSGRDCYVLSQLVGESGSVVGVDMTDEQLAVANRHIEYHREKFGYAVSNVEFKKGYIECLDELGFEDNSFDIIISNCVINLSPDKNAVLREAHRILKPGGELYFSDVYADRRIPAALVDDPVLYGECLSGALYWNDFHNLAKQCGFYDPRLVEDRPLEIGNPELIERIGHINFFSATYRLFKLDGLEPACEDHGQAVVYKGGIAHSEQDFLLDKHHLIEKGRHFAVCGNTYRMLNESRFAPHFEFYGSWDNHFGIFPGCGMSLPFDIKQTEGRSDGGSCC
ncbi:MAG: methyltransferase domain-containing protein [Candidatus Polarisedimenticolaceae bacterium]|nr:methyltransferase domain-containing protein [Candidatus Polarisedimenticolaceae bacterium]